MVAHHEVHAGNSAVQLVFELFMRRNWTASLARMHIACHSVPLTVMQSGTRVSHSSDYSEA
jgi:hypothetical protein